MQSRRFTLSQLPQVPWATRGVLLPAVLVLNSYGMMLTLRGMAAAGSFMGNVLALAANFVATVRFLVSAR